MMINDRTYWDWNGKFETIDSLGDELEAWREWLAENT